MVNTLNEKYDMIKKIGQKEFCDIVGDDSLPPEIISDLNNINSNYKECDEREEEYLILEILKKLNSNTLSLTGDKKKWENGWGESLKKYEASHSLDDLIPPFQSRRGIIRLFNRYALPENKKLEYDLEVLIHKYVFIKYFNNTDEIFEFGCGSGDKIKILSNIFPSKKLHGLDWVQQSVDTMNLMRLYSNINAYGHIFDILHPDYSLQFTDNCGVYTSAALEQVGKNHENFIKFLLDKKPKIIVNIEPIIEFYLRTNLFGYIGYMYDTQRQYLSGYYTKLLELEKENRIKILKAHHTKFGNFYHDSYSIIAWEII